MRPWSLLFVVPAVAMVAIGIAATADQDPVPLFTTEDLDRMFGPAPAQPSDPVDKTRPEDWRWIEQFLDRQYTRIDADRQFDLGRRSVDITARRVEQTTPIYGRSVAWGLGYPASTGWSAVGSRYATWGGTAACHPPNGGSRERDHRVGPDRATGHRNGHAGGDGLKSK